VVLLLTTVILMEQPAWAQGPRGAGVRANRHRQIDPQTPGLSEASVSATVGFASPRALVWAAVRWVTPGAGPGH